MHFQLNAMNPDVAWLDTNELQKMEEKGQFAM